MEWMWEAFRILDDAGAKAAGIMHEAATLRGAVILSLSDREYGNTISRTLVSVPDDAEASTLVAEMTTERDRRRKEVRSRRRAEKGMGH